MTRDELFAWLTERHAPQEKRAAYLWIGFGSREDSAGATVGYEDAHQAVISIGLQATGRLRYLMIEHPSTNRRAGNAIRIDARVLRNLLNDKRLRVEIAELPASGAAVDEFRGDCGESVRVYRDATGRVYVLEILVAPR